MHLPELAILAIDVIDNDTLSDDIIGNCYLPMIHLRQGYRNVPLYTKKGRIIPSAALLVKIEIDDPNEV